MRRLDPLRIDRGVLGGRRLAAVDRDAVRTALVEAERVDAVDDDLADEVLALEAKHDELAPLAKGLADMTIEELLPNPSIRVVERDQMNKIMDEQKLSSSGAVDPSTVVKLGKIVAAKYMLTGAYITMGNSLVLTMKAFSVETSEIVWTGSVTGKTDNILVLINQLASKATKGLNLPPLAPVQEQAQQAKAERIKLPLQEALKFARALDAKDAGKADAKGAAKAEPPKAEAPAAEAPKAPDAPKPAPPKPAAPPPPPPLVLIAVPDPGYPPYPPLLVIVAYVPPATPALPLLPYPPSSPGPA